MRNRYRYLFFLDDPLRVLPVSDFIETIESSNSQLSKSKVGILGICSSMEPHTGCLVTKLANHDEKNNRLAGFFTPSFVLNIDAVKRIGGLRKFDGSMVLSILDLSLRLEQNRYISNLLEVKSILCPSYSAQDYLAKSLVSAKSQFIKFWGRKPVALKPKYPPKDEQIGETADYQEWVRLCDTITDGDIVAFKKEANELGNKPLISVIMPVFDPPKKFLINAIESVISQAYENWELCIAGNASTKKYKTITRVYAGKLDKNYIS